MAKGLQIVTPIKLTNLTYFLRIEGTDVSIHMVCTGRDCSSFYLAS
jgi:hypothetical protein